VRTFQEFIEHLRKTIKNY